MALNVLEKSLNLTLPHMYEPWILLASTKVFLDYVGCQQRTVYITIYICFYLASSPTSTEVIKAYMNACARLRVKPIDKLVRQLKVYIFIF
jgi:hypothetical protein